MSPYLSIFQYRSYLSPSLCVRYNMLRNVIPKWCIPVDLLGCDLIDYKYLFLEVITVVVAIVVVTVIEAVVIEVVSCGKSVNW